MGMSTTLNPELLFRDSYARAKAVTVFWCPTIFRGADEVEHSLSRFLRGSARTGSEKHKLLLAAREEVNSYFDSFPILQGHGEAFLHLLEETLQRAAETGADRHQGLKKDTTFVDLAPSEEYKEIVQRLGKPANCRPSLGFYIDLPLVDAKTDDTTDDLEAAGYELSNLQRNLEFQIEATYEPPPGLDNFLSACREFLLTCRQYSLFIDFGHENSWTVSSLAAGLVFEKAKRQRVWHLKSAKPSDTHFLPHLICQRLNNHLSRQPWDEGRVFSDYVAPRWVQQARERRQSSFGATLSFPENDGSPVEIRINGFSHWLFEALFPPLVNHPRSSEVSLKDEPRPPDPILLSADNTDDTVARFAIYEGEPTVYRCLCGNEYPAHEGVPTIVPLREGARAWIERQYLSNRDAVGLDWRTLSAPRTYLVEAPEIWSKEEDDLELEAAIEMASRFWQNLLTTTFEAHQL